MTRLLDRFIKLLRAKPKEPRRGPRTADPLSLVYYWDGSAPLGDGLRDISRTGAYICTSQRWPIGAIVTLMLERSMIGSPGDTGDAPAPSTCIPCRVVRQGDDGVGVEFVFTTQGERTSLQSFLKTVPAGNAGKPPATLTEGHALIEFSLIIPLIFLLVVNVVNFGSFFFAWITVAHAARAGAQYGIRSGATVGNPTPPTAAQISTVITNAIFSLPNKASLQVRVCTNNNGVVTCTGTGSGATPADPEPLTYILAAVDVTYTYQPLIPLWDFPGLGIHATMPPTALHRKAVMRVLQ